MSLAEARRLHAVVQLLLVSGDLTPMGQRQIARVIDEITDTSKGAEQP